MSGKLFRARMGPELLLVGARNSFPQALHGAHIAGQLLKAMLSAS